MTDPDFYKLQNIWSNIYFREVSDVDIEKVRWVETIINNSFVDILELGAGGGQFSIAAALKGYKVTALEIESQFTDHIEKIKKDKSIENLTVVTADFYSIKLEEKFDLICYWDGFGVGKDDDQQHLLNNISNWLSPNGVTLIEVYTPWYWATKAAGVTKELGDVVRSYQFDANQSCMVDTWWHINDPEKKTTQRLRCCSPADLRLLLSPVDLQIEEIYPGGYVDFELGEYFSHAPLQQAMSYTVKLIHSKR